MKKLLLSSAAACLLLVFTASSVLAQSVRPEGTFYLMPQVGLADYYGDLDNSWTPEFEIEVPYMFGLEAGYQFTPSFGIGLSYERVAVPGAWVHPLVTEVTKEFEQRAKDESERNIANLMLRYAFGGSSATIAPYLEVGGSMVTGRPDDDYVGVDLTTKNTDAVGFGPAAGLGIDWAMSDQISLLIGLRARMFFPDVAVDGVDRADVPDPIVDASGTSLDIETSDTDWDMINTFMLGLKWSFESAFTPVEILSTECPSGTYEIGESVTFTATTNSDEATRPVEYTWNFGDGTTATGTVATHSYSRAGTYNVTFTAENRDSRDTATCTVTVEREPIAVEIISLRGNPTRFEVCEPVTVEFDADLRGDEPYQYSWDFGDGTSGTGEVVTHTYDEVGTYTVTLTASNAAGTTNRSITIEAERCTAGICYEITEMNSVFFDRNSSTLTSEARAALQENLEIFEECPNLCARIEGFAAPGERNPQQLSEDRARAVEQFYVDNGIAASRFRTTGEGQVGGTTSKKEGTSQFRRVDTIPVQCVDL